MPPACVIAVTGALYFADRDMKTADNFFRGFPAVWNLVAFYLLLLRPAPLVAAAAVALFAVLTFVPVRFVHPFRVRRLRAADGRAADACGRCWRLPRSGKGLRPSPGSPRHCA